MKCVLKNEYKLVCLKYNNTGITLVTITICSVICLLRLKEQWSIDAYYIDEVLCEY